MSVTIVDPVGIAAAGRATVLWVPAIADPSAPTLAEIQAGLNIGCTIDNWGPSVSQDTVSKRKYCDKFASERLGTAKYSVDPIEYEYDPQDPTNSTDFAAYSTLKPGTVGYFLDRRNVDAKADVVTGQIVDVYSVELGEQGRKALSGEEGETFMVQQQVAFIGDPAFDVAVV